MPDYNDEYTYENFPQRRRNPMSTAALALGILSITCCSVFYVALPCGAIAVICAILSRGKGAMPGKSKAGITCGIIGLVATVVITVTSFYYVLTTETGRSYLQYYYRIYSGDFDFDLDEALEEMFPFLYGPDNSTEDPGSGSDGSGNEVPDDGSDPYGSGKESPEGGSDSYGSGEEPPEGGSDHSGEQPEDSSPQQSPSQNDGGFI